MIIPTRGVSCEAAAFIAMFPEIVKRDKSRLAPSFNKSPVL